MTGKSRKMHAKMHIKVLFSYLKSTWLGCFLWVHGRAWYPLLPFECPPPQGLPTLPTSRIVLSLEVKLQCTVNQHNILSQFKFLKKKVYEGLAWGVLIYEIGTGVGHLFSHPGAAGERKCKTNMVSFGERLHLIMGGLGENVIFGLSVRAVPVT